MAIPEAQNKFAKHDAAKAAQRAATRISRTDAEERRDKRRENWVSPTRSQPQGGLILDQRTLALKASLLAETRKPEPKAAHMETSTVHAILETWLRRNPNFYDSDFNATSVRNFLLRAWHEKGIPPSIELLDSAYAWLQTNCHLESDPQVARKRGDVVRASAPRIFEYTTPEQAKELEQKQASEAVEKRNREDAFNRALSLDELRRRTQSGRGAVSRDALLRFQG